MLMAELPILGDVIVDRNSVDSAVRKLKLNNRSFVRPFFHSLVRSFARCSSARSFVRSFARSFTRSFASSLVRCSLVR